MSDSDEDDYRPPTRRRRTPVAARVAGGLILAGLVALGVLFSAELDRDARNAEHQLKSRDELRGLLIGKTGGEVRTLLGRPNDEDAGPDHHWDYRNVTRDPATGRPDLLAHVHFGPDGRVSQVDFDPTPDTPPFDSGRRK